MIGTKMVHVCEGGREAPNWMGQDGDLVVCIVACLSNKKIVCCCDALGSSKMDCRFVH